MTRMEAARNKLRIARYAIAITAAAGLAAFAAAARVSHPAVSQTSRQPATESSEATDESTSDDDGFYGGGYSLGPAGSAAPQVQSGGS